MDVRAALVTTLWGLSVCAGVVAMVRYEITPGIAATPPVNYFGQIEGSKGRLLVFLHPQCGCSKASVDELQRAMTHADKALRTTVYMYKPSTEPDSWCVGTGLWNAAKLIPGAKILVDTDGRAAKSYGVRCSGQVLVYASGSGKLVFSGGVTESRGHEGGSRGEDAIIEFANTGKCSIAKTNVFGCAIW
jgi:hypothetical protein